jgi:hypothetical protein
VQSFGGAISDTGATRATLPAWKNAGDSVQIAVDLDNRKIWFRTPSGQWNASGTADPATNTGGIALPTGLSTGAVFPAVSAFNTSPADTVTLVFDPNLFIGSVPTGFGTWG